MARGGDDGHGARRRARPRARSVVGRAPGHRRLPAVLHGGVRRATERRTGPREVADAPAAALAVEEKG
jgi:hypothetical protein